MPHNKFTLSVLVRNEAGVLTRVSGLFGRRGFNIDSLSVGETERPAFSRITVVCQGDEYTRDQIYKQLQKLPDVQAVSIMEPDQTVVRELMLIKVSAETATRAQLHQIVDVFRAKVVDLSTTSMTIETTGEKTKLDAFISNLLPYGILELCRTGVTAIGRNTTILGQEKEEE